jgi:pimeloyl-ACP methyl ester carboxylesterase
MPYFIRDKINFHYLQRRLSSTPALIFQHGLGGDTERVFDLLGPLPGVSFFGLDCRGHGDTSPLGDIEKLGFDSFADDVIALMEHLGLQQTIIGGTSMGAGVALNCILRYPHRFMGLILLRPAWLDGPMGANATAFGLVAQLLREHGPQNGLEIFKCSDVYKSIFSESPDSANSLLESFSHPRSLETVAKLERLPQDAPNRDRSEWRQILHPTLVLANRSDPIHPFEFGRVLAENIPNADFAELMPKSVNLAQYTADLRSNVTAFLQKHWPFTFPAQSDYA